MISEKLRTRQVWVLFIILFTDMIGFGMSIPLFGLLFGSSTNPFYVGNAIDVVNIAFYFGIFSALYGAGQFIANPTLGALSDTVGRKPVLSFAIFGTFISRIIFLIGLLQMNVLLMFFARFVDGGTGGIISLSNASVTDTTAPEERGKYLGRIMAGFSLGGFVVGPIIFTLFAYTGEYWSVIGPFALATFLSFISFITCILFFPETLPKEKINKIPSLMYLLKQILNTFDNLKTIFKHKDTKPFFIAAGVFYFAFSGFNTFTAQYLFSTYGLSAEAGGFYLLIVGVVMTIMQGFVAYKILKKYSMNSLILYLSTLLFICMLIFTYAYLSNFGIVLVFANAALFAFLISINMVAMQTEITKIKTENKGALIGAFSSVQVLAMALSPIIIGYIATFSTHLPFVISAILILISGILFKVALSK
jgi:MFS family permease